MRRLFSTLVKVAVASLAAGVALAQFDLSLEQVLREMGMTPEKVMLAIEGGLKWAVANMVLGSLVVVPVWLVVYLFRPPRG